jgi:hypothetical protein
MRMGAGANKHLHGRLHSEIACTAPAQWAMRKRTCNVITASTAFSLADDRVMLVTKTDEVIARTQHQGFIEGSPDMREDSVPGHDQRAS